MFLNWGKLKNLNNFSGDYFFIFLILIFSIIYFDIYSSLFLLSLVIVSKMNLGLDSKDIKKTKNIFHGINETKSSRLGGLLIFIFLFINTLNNQNFNPDIFTAQQFQFYSIIIIFITLLGFVDDIIGGLNNLLKLYFLFFSILILIITNNNFIINHTSVFVFDIFLNNYYFSFFITFIVISGFINASNISDGANGILSGLASIFIMTIFFITDNYYYLSIFKFLIIFFLYNIFISRVFLGDSGSYFLGFLISTLSLYFYNDSLLSAGFLASLLSYPCVEILYSIIRRLQKKQNPLRADNRHLHNLMFNYLKKIMNNSKLTNSLTGLCVTVLFPFPAFLFFFFTENSTNFLYWYLFLIQSLTYLAMYSYLVKVTDNLKLT